MEQMPLWNNKHIQKKNGHTYFNTRLVAAGITEVGDVWTRDEGYHQPLFDLVPKEWQDIYRAKITEMQPVGSVQQRKAEGPTLSTTRWGVAEVSAQNRPKVPARTAAEVWKEVKGLSLMPIDEYFMFRALWRKLPTMDRLHEAL